MPTMGMPPTRWWKQWTTLLRRNSDDVDGCDMMDDWVPWFVAPTRQGGVGVPNGGSNCNWKRGSFSTKQKRVERDISSWNWFSPLRVIIIALPMMSSSSSLLSSSLSSLPWRLLLPPPSSFSLLLNVWLLCFFLFLFFYPYQLFNWEYIFFR